MGTLDIDMKLSYQITVLKINDSDGCYYKVTVPTLPGLVVYVDTWSDIKNELENSAREWFVSRLKQGKTIPFSDSSNKGITWLKTEI